MELNKLETFKEMYSFYNKISGNHGGILNNKIYQINISQPDVNYYAMTADFPNYGRLLNEIGSPTYHLAGYGCTREESLIRLIGEAIERYSSVYSFEFLKNNIVYGTYNELSSKYKLCDVKYLNVHNLDKNIFLGKIDQDTVIGWVKVYNVSQHEDILIPAQMFFLGYNNSNIFEPKTLFSVSTGTATHVTIEKALENALVEYLQIDSFMLFWYSKNIKVPKVNLDKKMKKIIKKFKLVSENDDLLILDLTLDKPFPIFGVFIIKKEYPYFSFGVQGGKDPYQTLYRAILEANTVMQYNLSAVVYESDKFLAEKNIYDNFLDLDSNVLFWAKNVYLEEKNKFINKKIDGIVNIFDYQMDDTVLVKKCIDFCRKNHFDIACFDITCSELGNLDWTTIRTVIPQLIPMCLPSIPYDLHPRYCKYGGCDYELPHPLP